jgi:hypothetical protein
VSEGRWRISVTAPDWGEDHLTLDAIVAFVDDELGSGPRERATRHAARCRECAAQVVAQTQARVALRTAAGPRLPSSLLSSLRSIPQHAELPSAPAGLAMSADGQIVTRTRPEPTPSARADAAVPSTHMVPAPPDRPTAPTTHNAEDAPPAGLGRSSAADHGRRRSASGRMRFGTGVAVSGLALGALAFGATSASPTAPAPSPERGVLGGPVLGGPGAVEARLRFGTQTSRSEAVLDGFRGAAPDAVGSLRGLW